MAGQYPSGYSSPVRQGFPMQMNQMGVPNQMGMMGYNQNNMMQNQQQQMQGPMQTNQAAGVGGANVQQMPPQLSLTPTTPNLMPNSVMMQQQPPQQQQQPPPHMNPNATQPQLQQKELNVLTLCRIGQETVQDIVTRFQEVFGLLKNIQPPNGTNAGATASTERKAKVQEHFRTIRLLFKRLRLLYDKCNDNCQQGMEYTHVESLIPLKDEADHKPEPPPTEEYKKSLQENRELIEIVILKNKQLREVIDRIRIIIWEINTMLSMRRS